MTIERLKRKAAIVTGASQGIGREIARELVKRDYDVILVGRNEQALEELTLELGQDYAYPLCLDLLSDQAVDILEDVATKVDLHILVNNAGVGCFGKFDQSSPDAIEQMIKLNITLPVLITRALLKHLAKNGKILQVASIAGHMPMPLYAAYGASKAFLRSFSFALGHELRHQNLTVSILSPGPVATNFFKQSGQEVTAQMRLLMKSPEFVAHKAVEGLLSGKKEIIPSILDRMMLTLAHFSPRAVNVFLAHQVMRKRM